MITLQERPRWGTRNCATCRYYRIKKLSHPAEHGSSDIYCSIGTADLKLHIDRLEWRVCANWDALQDPRAVAVYDELMLEWCNDTL